MLDRYWSGQTHRISPEAPVPIVHVEDSDDRPGGAANVALNLAALGMHVRLAGLIGDDDAGVQLGANLEASGVNASLVRTTHPTITKLRVMSRHQQLIRLDNEQRFRHSDSAQLLAQAGDQLDGIDALVISDYAKGSLTAVLPTLVQEARRREIPVLIDPKGQDFGPYRGATLLTPNRGEFERIAGQFEDEAQRAAAAENLIAQLSLEALLLTRSEEGMSLYRPGHAPLHLPAQQHEVFDVTGAGDTVIATLAA
ncbi:MAG: PfkB family carbohydrate kinase, partial [Pseudomonadota bacterium]